MSAPSVFGHIVGYPPGISEFSSRDEVRLAGLHRHKMNGISGNYEDGADAICLNGGHKDDRDMGESALYTGEGGQDETGTQIKDQLMVKGNLALARSCERGLPVRVVRGYRGDKRFSPNRDSATTACTLLWRARRATELLV